jgi:pyridoxal/pyridoxine/pyridoxamine kinase
MRPLFQVSAITSLLVVMASVAYAGQQGARLPTGQENVKAVYRATTVKGSKSNSDNRVAVYDSVMTPTQATAFLAEWDKIPLGSTNEAAVRGFLQKVLGNKAGSIKKIIIQTNRKPPSVIVLGDPMLESEALRVAAAPFGHNAPLK